MEEKNKLLEETSEIIKEKLTNKKKNNEHGGLSLTIEKHLHKYFAAHGNELPPPELYKRILKEVERPLLKVSLDATNGNQLKTANLLGLNRNTLRKKLIEHKIKFIRKVE